MKRIDQTETRQHLRSFLQHTGLKRVWVAEKCCIPYTAFCEFYNDRRSIPRQKERELNDFMKRYLQANSEWISLGTF